jgi:riboflavin synthase
MMFTGIVTELGEVSSMELGNGVARLTVVAPLSTVDMGVGDSIAVNGVCLTAVVVQAPEFSVEVVDETFSRSSLGDLEAHDPVNLERPMAATGRYDGHIVQGHVDGVGTVSSVLDEGEARRYRISLSDELCRYTVEKGSIAVDGTSLTITAVSSVGAPNPWFEMVVIPHTLEATVLGNTTAGSRVNLETDVIAKYVERMAGCKG